MRQKNQLIDGRAQKPGFSEKSGFSCGNSYLCYRLSQLQTGGLPQWP